MDPRFAMVAGEASGDLLAGLLLGGMQARWPQMQAAGIGGPQMAARGFEAWWPHDKLAVRGYVEVLRHYREIVGIRRALRDRLLADKPAAFIGVDAPDFNLDLERDLKAAGIRTVHFVCPSIWAWRPERVAKIRASCDRVLCIFPFEPVLLHDQGIRGTYVGHPLANVLPMEPDRQAARMHLGLPADAEVVAVLPGSRAAEVHALAHRFFGAAVLLARQRPDVHFAVPAMPALRGVIEAAAARVGLTRNLHIVTGQSHAVLTASDVVLVASGTATLEAALCKRPMVIGYHMHWFSWRITQRKRLQPWVGLPNILAGEFVVPELLQERCEPELLAGALLDWLRAPDKMAAVQDTFRGLHHELQRDTAKLAADGIEETLR